MGKVFLDKIPAGEHIESVVSTDELQNGQFLSLGVLEEDGETRVATKATKAEDAEVFHVSAPISYDLPDFDIGKWTLKAGKQGRAYHLGKGDVISVTPDLVADQANVANGDLLTVGTDGLGFAKAGEGQKVIGKLIAKNDDHGFDGEVFVIAIK